MEPLITKTDAYSYSFYRKLIENIKQTKDMQDAECELTNNKLYAVCDLAMGLVMTKTTNFVLKEFPAEPLLPAKLYTKIDLVSHFIVFVGFCIPSMKLALVQNYIQRHFCKFASH